MEEELPIEGAYFYPKSEFRSVFRIYLTVFSHGGYKTEDLAQRNSVLPLAVVVVLRSSDDVALLPCDSGTVQ